MPVKCPRGSHCSAHAGYAEPPEITIDSTDIGSGFRALGIPNVGSTELVGWDDRDPGTITGTAPTALEAYGDKDGTENQKIAYKTTRTDSTTRLADWAYRWNLDSLITPDAGYPIPMESVVGLRPGNVVRSVIYNMDGTFHSFYPARTIIAVDEVNKTVTLNYWAFTTAGQNANGANYIYTFVL